MNNFIKPLTSKQLENFGQIIYMLSVGFFFIGLCGVGMLAVVISITALIDITWVPMLLSCDIHPDYWLMYPVMFIIYSFIILGIAGAALFPSGLLVFGIGRIAHNTESVSDTGLDVRSKNSNKNSTDSKSKGALLDNDGWKCTCGEINPIYATRCICGKSVLESKTEVNATKPKPTVEYREPEKKLPCPECGADLDFMGWTEEDLQNEQICPLCDKKITFKVK